MTERPVPTTYRNRIRNLEHRISLLEARVTRRDNTIAALRRRLGTRPTTMPIEERQARDHRCDECGAERLLPCRTPGDLTRPAHHMRGRSEHCGSEACGLCLRAFMEREAAE